MLTSGGQVLPASSELERRKQGGLPPVAAKSSTRFSNLMVDAFGRRRLTHTVRGRERVDQVDPFSYQRPCAGRKANPQAYDDAARERLRVLSLQLTGLA
jgi:hypothetical protein